MSEKPEYIEFIVAPYAFDTALKALMNNGVVNIAVMKEDDYLYIKYKNIDYNSNKVVDCNGVNR